VFVGLDGVVVMSSGVEHDADHERDADL